MNVYELGILLLALLGLGLCVRGLRRVSLSDAILGVILVALACAGYFFLFNLTRTPYLAAMICGAGVVVLLTLGRVTRTNSGRVLAVVMIVLAAVAFVGEHKLLSAGNALLVIEPYRTGKGWAFDEPRVGLKAEPFVLGVPEMIDRLSSNVPGADKRVRLIFSQNPFPGAVQLDRRNEENGGNWYYWKDHDMTGWLCPALFKFFPRAPRHIYVKAEAS